MRHNEETFTGGAGVPIFWQSWLPDGPPKAVVVVAHGFGEHSGRYANVVDELVPRNYAVYAPDHRGHGRSGGTRALIDKFDYILNDLDVVFAYVSRDYPGAPTFLLGHSMGGNIALGSALRKQSHLKGLILSGPAISTEGVPKILRLIMRVLGKIAPKLGVRQLSADSVSRDPAVVKAYVDDPLVYHGKVPAGTGANMMKMAKDYPTRLPSLTVPLLVVHGSADELVPAAAGQLAHDLAGSKDKTIKIYDGLAHEVFNEPERAIVLADVANWLDDRV